MRNICRDCRYFVINYSTIIRNGDIKEIPSFLCSSSDTANIISGAMVSCEEARKKFGACDLSGNLFEAKE